MTTSRIPTGILRPYVLLLIASAGWLHGSTCGKSSGPTVYSLNFQDRSCPSLYAPPGCGTATDAQTCHETWVDATCTTGNDVSAETLTPEDIAPDAGESRAWSFRIRPYYRSFDPLLYQEATGSVRLTSDGQGAAGSVTGASDEAHLRISTNKSLTRVFVLRWWTAGLPAGTEARLRFEVQGGPISEHVLTPGPAVADHEVFPFTWNNARTITVSASITGPRDAVVDSADLLWHLAVLQKNTDEDFDGIANYLDADPLDRNIPTETSPPARPRVLVIGLDGAGWDVLDVLMQNGRVPTLSALVDGGARAPLYEPDAIPNFCCFCPIQWTSLGCGEIHANHLISNVSDEPWDRPVPAVWQYLARQGGTVTHVSYRNTFPAEPGTTYNVAEPGLDSAAKTLFDTWGEAGWWGTGDRGEFMNRLQRSWPPLLLETLGVLPGTPSSEPVYWPFARDRVSADVVTALAASDPTDLTMWILHAPDKSEHAGWDAIQTEHGVPIDANALDALAQAWTGPVTDPAPDGKGTVASQYLEADPQVAALLQAASYDYVVLISDHAMSLNSDYPTLPPGEEDIPGHHTPDEPDAHVGIFAVSGPGVVPGVSLSQISVLDVAPTLAYLLDLPVATSLPGRVVSEAFTPAHLSAHPVQEVPYW